jgi:hypothetical protein
MEEHKEHEHRDKLVKIIIDRKHLESPTPTTGASRRCHRAGD